MGDLLIHISTSSTTTHSGSYQLQSYTSFSQTGHTSAWTSAEISLNSYRTTDSTFYIYSVADGATSFRCDIAIDNVEFSEGG